jgi:hypothetical protein
LVYPEKIWKLEEIYANPLSIQKLEDTIDNNMNEYHLIELNDLENESLIKE